MASWPTEANAGKTAREQLRLLSVPHEALAGVVGLFSLFPLLAVLLLQAGCSLLLGSGPEPLGHGTFPEPLEEAPPTTFIYVGVVQDFATFRPEPDAVIEFWSEHPSYTPAVQVDGRGGFSVRVDSCRRPATMLDDTLSGLLFALPFNCRESIGGFGIRARVGTRCSFPVDGPPLAAPAAPGRLVLWLRDCVEPLHGAHHWRPALQVVDAQAPG